MSPAAHCGRRCVCDPPTAPQQRAPLAMKTLTAATLCALAALLASGSAGATEYGVTEDMGKASPAWILRTVQDLGMTRNVVSLGFDPSDPGLLPQQDEIDA